MKPNTQTHDRLELLKSHFQNGRYGDLLPILHLLRKKALSSSERVVCASIARQSGSPRLAVDLLRKRVYPADPEGSQGASARLDIEVAEYAAATALMGGQGESERLFQSLYDRKTPEILLLEAQGHLAVFDYEQALPLLRRYLSEDLFPAHRRAAELRLLLCSLRAPLRDEATAERLLAAFLDRSRTDLTIPEKMYAGQMSVEFAYFLENKPAKALERAAALTRAYPQHNSTGLFLWEALLTTVLKKESTLQSARIEQERARVISEGNGYALRQFDLYRAALLRDQRALTRFIVGTPYPGMRGLALRWFFDRNVELPEKTFWRCGIPWTETERRPGGRTAHSSSATRSHSRSKEPCFDLDAGTISGYSRSLRKQDLLWRLLVCLCSDFYGPKSEHELHEFLYPGEPHRGLESTQKIYTLIHRLRKWLEQAKIPLFITAQDRLYRISEESQVAFSLTRGTEHQTLNERTQSPDDDVKLAHSLRKHFSPDRRFSSGEMAEALSISPRNAVYKLKELCRKGLISAEGKGPARRYRLI